MMTKESVGARRLRGPLMVIRGRWGMAAVDAAKRFCMMRVPRRTQLVGLGVAVATILAAGGSASADQRPPLCSSMPNPPSVFKILDNQTYALCATASCLVFNGVAYCQCDVKTGDSIAPSLEFDDGQDICTVNAEGVNNGYMVSTFSPPASVGTGGEQAVYTCPGAKPGKAGSDGAYAQCGGGICFKSTQGQSFPGFDQPPTTDDIICSCPITNQDPRDPVGYQIVGPFPCEQSFFDNCNRKTANSNTGSTLHVGGPTGSADLLTFLLTGSRPPSQNRCFQKPH